MKEVYTSYSAETNMTFILEDTYENEDVISVEVKGFYFGEPDEKLTKQYYGKVKADFTK